MPQSSRIFVKNRAIGYVSDSVPCITRFLKRRKQHVIVTSVGTSFHTYDRFHLTLLTVSDPSQGGDILSLAGDSRYTYTSSGNNVYAWKAGTTLVHTYKGHSSPVHSLLPFGEHIISVDEENNLKVWDRNTEEQFLELNFDRDNFLITALNHPSTYINKILIGSDQGSMQLWNIKSGKLVFTFAGWTSPITVLEQAPALDVTAIGLRNGNIVLHNLKYDETLMEFTQTWGPVTSISFRTDGPPIMASGTTTGHIMFWDLKEKKVTSQLMDAHCTAVGSAKFLPNEPILITSSSDNTLKMWIFDQADSSGRLLRLREGHGSQPTHIRFHGNNGYYVMSSGLDSSLRVFSTVNETLNYSLGKASYNKKLAKRKKHVAEKLLMPPIVEFTSETTRDKEWDGIASVHRGLPIVTTWSFDKRKMGDLKLLPERFSDKNKYADKVVATCVSLTSCGNYVIIGYSSGHVDRFNIQSGLHRCQYGSKRAHRAAVQGAIPDILNQMVISAGATGVVKFWPFKPPGASTICSRPLSMLNVQESISFFRSHKDSILLAVILEDYDIILIDIESKKIVRKLQGHSGRITDAAFTPDCKWLITASMDNTIRTWDLPNAALIDIFRVSTACISLALSPSGHLLATVHVDSRGIYLWSNKSLYDELALTPISDKDSPLLDLPSSRGKDEAVTLDEDDFMAVVEESNAKSIDQIGDLVTLSGKSTSQWLNLLDIDIIRKRNKPKNELKVAEKAPFFLPTIPSLGDIKFDLTSAATAKDSIKNLKLTSIKNYTAFGNMLEKTRETDDFTEVIEKIREMGPGSIDLEINAMALEAQGSEVLLLQFMKMINKMLGSKRDYELSQSYLALFLKVHGQAIVANDTLRDYLKTVQNSQTQSWNELQKDLLFLTSLVDAFKRL